MTTLASTQKCHCHLQTSRVRHSQTLQVLLISCSSQRGACCQTIGYQRRSQLCHEKEIILGCHSSIMEVVLEAALLRVLFSTESGLSISMLMCSDLDKRAMHRRSTLIEICIVMQILLTFISEVQNHRHRHSVILLWRDRSRLLCRWPRLAHPRYSTIYASTFA